MGARLCPIFFAARRTKEDWRGMASVASVECVERACAWYDKGRNCCAVLLLALSLGKIAEVEPDVGNEPSDLDRFKDWLKR